MFVLLKIVNHGRNQVKGREGQAGRSQVWNREIPEGQRVERLLDEASHEWCRTCKTVSREEEVPLEEEGEN